MEGLGLLELMESSYTEPKEKGKRKGKNKKQEIPEMVEETSVQTARPAWMREPVNQQWKKTNSNKKKVSKDIEKDLSADDLINWVEQMTEYNLMGNCSSQQEQSSGQDFYGNDRCNMPLTGRQDDWMQNRNSFDSGQNRDKRGSSQFKRGGRRNNSSSHEQSFSSDGYDNDWMNDRDKFGRNSGKKRRGGKQYNGRDWNSSSSSRQYQNNPDELIKDVGTTDYNSPVDFKNMNNFNNDFQYTEERCGSFQEANEYNYDNYSKFNRENKNNKSGFRQDDFPTNLKNAARRNKKRNTLSVDDADNRHQMNNTCKKLEKEHHTDSDFPTDWSDLHKFMPECDNKTQQTHDDRSERNHADRQQKHDENDGNTLLDNLSNFTNDADNINEIKGKSRKNKRMRTDQQDFKETEDGASFKKRNQCDRSGRSREFDRPDNKSKGATYTGRKKTNSISDIRNTWNDLMKDGFNKDQGRSKDRRNERMSTQEQYNSSNYSPVHDADDWSPHNHSMDHSCQDNTRQSLPEISDSDKYMESKDEDMFFIGECSEDVAYLDDYDNSDDLPLPKWNKGTLTEIEKNVYVPSTSVLNRNPEDISSFRNRSSIIAKGDSIPAPIQQISDYNFSTIIKDKIMKLCYQTPSPVQAQAWPVALCGRDFVVISRDDPGTILSYLLPGFIHINNQPRLARGDSPLVVILTSSQQRVDKIHTIAQEYIKSFRLGALCITEQKTIEAQLHELSRGVEVCIALPKRFLEILKSKKLKLDRTSYLVIDNIDRIMETGGNNGWLQQIIDQTRPERQLLAFTSTFPKQVQGIVAKYMKNYIKLYIGAAGQEACSTVAHNVQVCNEKEKKPRLINLLQRISKSDENYKAVMFVKSKNRADEILSFINSSGFNAVCTYSEKSVAEHTRVIKEFRNARFRILIASDVVARGLNVDDVTHVINIDLPANKELYLSRISQCGKSGKKGCVYSFLTCNDDMLVDPIISMLKKNNQFIDPKLIDLSTTRQTLKGFSGNRYNPPSQSSSRKDQESTGYRSGRGRKWSSSCGSYGGSAPAKVTKTFGRTAN